MAAGIGIFYGYQSIVTNAWNPLFNPGDEPRQWFMIVPLVLGVLLYTRFLKKGKWISRIPGLYGGRRQCLGHSGRHRGILP